MDRSVSADREDDVDVLRDRDADDLIRALFPLAIGELDLPAGLFADDRRRVDASIDARAAIHDEECLHTIASRWRSNHAAQNGSSHKVSPMIATVRSFGGGGPKAVER